MIVLLQYDEKLHTLILVLYEIAPLYQILGDIN